MCSSDLTDGPSSTTPIGVIHGTISLSAVDELIRSLDLGEFGYGFLVSNKNFVISHPFGTEQADRIGIDAGPARRDAVRGMFNTLHTGKAAVIEHVVDPVTGEPSWVFSEPVPATGWPKRYEPTPVRAMTTAQARMTVGVPTKSAIGPTMMMGTKLARLTSVLRTPKTRPRTSSGKIGRAHV